MNFISGMDKSVTTAKVFTADPSLSFILSIIGNMMAQPLGGEKICLIKSCVIAFCLISRDVITKAIDFFVKKQTYAQDLNDLDDDVAGDVEADENWNTVIEDSGDGPHDTELCQMCQYLRRPCVGQRQKRRN